MSAKPVGLNGIVVAYFRPARDGHFAPQFRGDALCRDGPHTNSMQLHPGVSAPASDGFRLTVGTDSDLWFGI